MHDPLVHTPPGGQALPQPPQFWGSTSTSTQTVPQRLCSGPHTQVLFWQIEPGPQALPQVPQLLGSTVVSVQAPPQTT